MPTWLIKLFHSLGRKQAAKRTGIAQIPTRISAEGQGAGLYTQLREAGFSDEALTKLIKSEQDIIRLVNKVEAQTTQNNMMDIVREGVEKFKTKKSADVHPFQGFTPKIVPKDKTLLRDSPEAIAKIKADNKAAAERLRKKKLDEEPDDFASGGIARVGFAEGKSYDAWLNYRLKEIAKGNLPVPFKEWQKGDIKMASGGIARVGMFLGGGLKLKKFLLNKKTIRKAVDDIFPTGDYKYDAEMAAEALVENNPKFFKNKLYDDLSDADRMEVYGSVLSEVQNDLAKMLEARKLSKPTKTLEGIKKEGTIDISDPEVADEFSRFMKESDPKGYKDLEQKIEIEGFDVTGRKKNASGGIAGQLHLNRPGYFKGRLVKFLKENSPYQAYKKYLKYVKETAKKDPAKIAPEMGALTSGSILVNRALQRKLQKAKEDKKAEGGIAGQLHLNRPGYASGLKVYPKIDITETGQTPAEGIDVGVRDITYGGTGLYQGDKWFAGAEGLTGDVKVDVTAGGETLYKDSMSKEDALNYIIGLGDPEGDKFQIKSDEDFNNVQIVFKKKFAKGGLAKILGV